jgi:hypothetical protein
VFRFRLTRADARAYAALGGAFAGGRAILLWLAVVVGGIASGWTLEETGRPFASPAGVATIGLVTGAAFGLAGVGVRLDRARTARRLPLAAGDTTVTLDADAITFARDGGTRRIALADVAHVVATDSHLFLFTAPDDVEILPGGAIGDAAAIRALGEAIDRIADAATA